MSVASPTRQTGRSTRGAVSTIGFVGYGTVGSTIGTRARAVGLALRIHDPEVASSVPLEEVGTADVVLLCLPTPLGNDGRLDTSLVGHAVSRLRNARAIVIVSTLNPGTCSALQARYPKTPMAHVPEFLRQAHAADDFRNAARVVVGCDDPSLTAELRGLYAMLVPTATIVVVSPTEAEITKLASNAFLATKVVFANQAAAACTAAGADWALVSDALGLDPRINPSHLSVTAEGGFDGACLPKDTAAFATWLRTSVDGPSLASRVLAANAELRASEAPPRGHRRGAGS